MGRKNMSAESRSVFEQAETFKSWDEDYYNEVSERYYDDSILTMLRLMEVDTGATVLDAGCGPGVHSARVACAGFRVCAIDISETMLREAEKRVAAVGQTTMVEFRREDLTKLSFRNESFRFAFSWGVIIHIHEVEKALDELARVIEPGGALALYVTNKDAFDYKIEYLIRFLLRKPLKGREALRFGDGNWYIMHDEKLWLWRFDIPELERQLAVRGFHLKQRTIGELSEFQRHFGERLRWLRRLLISLNNLAYRLKLPPKLGVTNLLVFQKEGRQHMT